MQSEQEIEMERTMDKENLKESLPFSDSYQLRHNREKLFVRLFLELLSYDKKKTPTRNLEDEIYFKYVESIIILLFHYIFNLNKDNKQYAIEYANEKKSCSTSASESDTEEESDKDDEFTMKEKQEFEQLFRHCKAEKEDLKKQNNKENEKALNDLSIETKETREKRENQEKNWEHMCEEFFFQQHLDCDISTPTLKQKKKVEINILNIYYTEFYSTIIDTLLNNSQIEICDFIFFFLFDCAGTINQINAFFSEGVYTLDHIYQYILQKTRNSMHIQEDLKEKDDAQIEPKEPKQSEEQVEIIHLKNVLDDNMDSEMNLFQNKERISSQIEKLILSDYFIVSEKYKLKLNEPYQLLQKFTDVINVQLEKSKHFHFCLDIFFSQKLRLSYLEASKPWIFYWAIHTIYILYNNEEIENRISKHTFNYIKACIFLYLHKIKSKKYDSFGGGLNQYTHIATTYASICVFIYLHDSEHNFLSYIDRNKLHSYILELKCPNGSFRLHKGGEIDLRGTYCAIAVCSMCHILTKRVKKNVVKYILSCQNYEGGFSSETMQECHGGYTYCALATLCILGKVTKVNMNNLKTWLINKQSNMEGALMGRTNKLVDACYSFWIGACYFLINEMEKIAYYSNVLKQKKEILSTGELQLNPTQKKQINKNVLCNLQHLRLYLLCCSQNKRGGMRDKPTAKVDYYHTCYALSGMSLIENYFKTNATDDVTNTKKHTTTIGTVTTNDSKKLNKIHILYNINLQEVYKSYHFFSPDFPLHGDKINYRMGQGAYIYLKSSNI